MAATMTGCFVLTDSGKTTGCHSSVKFPDSWDASHTGWLKEISMIRYLEKLKFDFKQQSKKSFGYQYLSQL